MSMLPDRSAESRKRARGEEPSSPRDNEVDPHEVVSIRAGERLFTAERETWTSFPDSVVAMLVKLHEGPGEVDAYLDVDSDAFARVVSYLRRRGPRNVVPPESNEALDAFAACADKVGLHRLHAELWLEGRRRFWEAELARLDRNINAQEAQLRAMIDDAVRKSAKCEGKPDVEVTTRIVDISRSAKEAAKSARPLHYGGHPDLASNGANTADELETEIQELCDAGYSVKSILPLVSGGYSEGWGPEGDRPHSGEAVDVTTLVLVTAEFRADEPAEFKMGIFGQLSIVHLLHAFVKKLYQHYYRWLLNMLAQSREMLRSDFAPRSIRGDQIDLDGLTMEALRYHLVMALRAAPIPDETIERNMESFFVYFFGNATMAVAGRWFSREYLMKYRNDLFGLTDNDRIEDIDDFIGEIVKVGEDIYAQHRAYLDHLYAAFPGRRPKSRPNPVSSSA
jgi:hypothetical protein